MIKFGYDLLECSLSAKNLKSARALSATVKNRNEHPKRYQNMDLTPTVRYVITSYTRKLCARYQTYSAFGGR